MKNIKMGKMKPKRQFSPMRAIMLLLLLGFAAGNAMAQYRVKPQHRDQPADNGLYIDKQFKQDPNNPTAGSLFLESYVTGEVKKILASRPTDIVLVLDNSSSMTRTMGGSVIIGYNAETKNFTGQNYTEDYYFRTGTEGNYEYFHVLLGQDGNGGNAYYWLYYEDNNGKNWYLKDNGDVDENIVKYKGHKTTLYNGTLYKRTEIPDPENPGTARIDALKAAVCTFIEMIAQDAKDHPGLNQYGNEVPVDHKISIVIFDENDHDVEVNGQTGLLPVVTSWTSDNVEAMKAAVNAITTGSGTRQDLGLGRAFDNLPTPTLPLEDYLRKNVVVLFTDGEPSGASQSDCVLAAYPLKQNPTGEEGNNYKAASVYTVGTFDSPTTSTLNFMSYMSSNYPDAIGTGSAQIGTPAPELKYSFTADTPENLSSIFESIAEESGGSTVDLGTETVIQDVISDYFQLPQNADGNPITEGIKVYTAKCIGVDEDHPGQTIGDYTYDSKGRAFGSMTEVTEEEGYHLRFSDDYTSIQVDGFDFKENWCGLETDEGTPEPHGYKLILEIPIVPKEDAWGDAMPTNGALSVISKGEDITPDNIIDYFVSPTHTITRNTWVEYVKSKPAEWSADNIDSAEDLAWLISVVCGYNGQTAAPQTNATITADIDMSAYNWVPIGGTEGYWTYNEDGTPNSFVPAPSKDGYTGIFDGGGHSITGLRNQPSKVFAAGLFGKVNHGTIKNTFVMDCDFNTGTEGYFGIIADTLCNGGVIYNCEAAGQLKSCDKVTQFLDPYATGTGYHDVDPLNIHLGGLVGLVDNSEVHSCISVAELYGYNMGGLVNETCGNNAAMENSYSYPTFYHWFPSAGGNVGGMVAVNGGKLVNCYIRERESNAEFSGGIKYALDRIDDSAPHSKAEKNNGLLVGVNSGSASYLYMPDTWWPEEGELSQVYVGKGEPAASIGKFSITETPYMYLHKDNQVTMLSAKDGEPATEGLLAKLNDVAWQDTPERAGESVAYTSWFRTTADGINNDYPVLKIMNFNSVGSDDLIRLYYGDINHMMGTTSMYSENKDDDTYCIYQNAAVTTGNNDATLYINEDVAILQEESLDAYVGITLDNSAGEDGAMSGHPTQPNPDDKIDWHMFSTSLSNAPLGINYTDEDAHDFSYDADENPDYYFFPEVSTGADGEVVKDGYFPSKTYGTGANYNADWDFYTFEEKYHHWMNFKRNRKSHWDEDPETGHKNLPYGNDNDYVLEKGKGYLLAIANETFLQSHGTLNNGELTYQASYMSNPFTMGYNLIGNPYQSYLDFSEFSTVNGIDSYVILDEDAQGYVTVAASGSDNTYPEGYVAPGNMIHMHQGFFVHVDKPTEITFNNDMRSIDKTSEPYFRGSKHNYPLVNLVVKEENGNREYLTVETNRPSVGGAKKLNGLRAGNSQMYAHADNNDYAILFATEDMNEVPVRFTTEADATYTMIWNTQNGEFTKLQLIDNITGVTVDMLASDEYTFTSKTTDFESRFRLVFHAIDNDEDDGEAETEDGDFAFFDGSNLVVSGTGMLSVCDINGRVIYSTNLNGTQSSVSMPDMARGLYLLRLTNSASTKVQKIVIRK